MKEKKASLNKTDKSKLDPEEIKKRSLQTDYNSAYTEKYFQEDFIRVFFLISCNSNQITCKTIAAVVHV